MTTKKERIEQERIKVEQSGWLPYEKAREHMRTLKLSSYEEFREYIKDNKLPPGIPRAPHRVYTEQFSSTDYLNTKKWQREKISLRVKERKQKQGPKRDHGSIFIPFEQARAFVHTLNFPSQIVYINWVKENKDQYPFLPQYPHRSYYNQWISWKDYLGTDVNPFHYSERGYCSYIEARKFVSSLGLNSSNEFKQWCQENKEVRVDIPRMPHKVYGKEWDGWDVFLGKNVPSSVLSKQPDINVLFIAQEPDVPSNVYTIGMEPYGPSAVYNEIIVGRKGKVLKLYNIENEYDSYKRETKQQSIQKIIEMNCQEYSYGGSDHYVVKNINQLIWDLFSECEEIPVKVPQQISSITGLSKQQQEDQESINQSLTDNLFDQL